MNGVRQSWLVAEREIRERGRSRGFFLSLVLMLIAVAAAMALPALLDTGPGAKDIGLAGSIPTELPATLEAQGDAVDTAVVPDSHRQPLFMSDSGEPSFSPDGGRLAFVHGNGIRLAPAGGRGRRAGAVPGQRPHRHPRGPGGRPRHGRRGAGRCRTECT